MVWGRDIHINKDAHFILEQAEKDISAAHHAVDDIRDSIEKLKKELRKLEDQLKASEVYHFSVHIEPMTCLRYMKKETHAKADRKLQEERATLTRFDNELKDLERVIKTKKQAVSDADLNLKKLEHDIQTLAKDKAAIISFVTNLEKQFEWIQEEHTSVFSPFKAL